MVVHVGLLLTIQAALCIAGDLQLEPFLQKHGLARPSIEDRHVQDIAHDLDDTVVFSTRKLLQHQEEVQQGRRLLADGQQPAAAGGHSGRAFNSRCRVTRGKWCGPWYSQTPIPWTPAPRGSKPCPNDCSHTGNCNHDTGVCDCPAGWTGPDCSTKRTRPCTNRYRDEKEDEPTNHTDATGRDLNWLDHGWMMTRCPGICDSDIAACYCDGDKYSYKPPPPPSAEHPYGTAAVKYGRTISDNCFPTSDWQGKKTSWGVRPYEQIYGEDGWCNATSPKHACGCALDGFWGDGCEQRYQQTCLNQCHGHGECVLGFCKCHKGWYGMDCGRKMEGEEMEESQLATRPWLKAHVGLTPEAQPVLPSTPRRRPLIYVYELPPEYTTRMHQYRIHSDACVYRKYLPGNHTQFVHYNLYNTEMYFLEALSQSEFRTYDPEKADFFYVPPYTACWIHPVFAAADFPWFWGPLQLRVLQASNMLLDVKRYIQKTYPWWDRRGGRDHIWALLHDEGACWAPTEITNHSIILTHWGRTDRDHISNTAYGWDNYTQDMPINRWQPYDWRLNWKGGLCYNPSKDLVIPSLKPPDHYKHSPLMGALPQKRDVLMYFKGDVGVNRPLQWYSRGIRQAIYRAAKANNWREKYNIMIGYGHELPNGYSEWLARSKYCLVAPGDGWSARMEDAMLHGCVPVIIMDKVHAVYESILDVDQFAVHVLESQVKSLPQILLSIPEDKLVRMQRRIARVWHRYAYTTGTLLSSMHASAQREASTKAGAQIANMTAEEFAAPRYPRAVKRFPHEDDAFHTIMQWLYSRIPDTR